MKKRAEFVAVEDGCVGGGGDGLIFIVCVGLSLAFHQYLCHSTALTLV